MADIKIKAHFIELSHRGSAPLAIKSGLQSPALVTQRQGFQRHVSSQQISLGMLHACAVILLRRCEMGFLENNGDPT
jgi:hypothetical protein